MSLSRLVANSTNFADFWEAKPLLSRDLGSMDDVISPEILEEAVLRRGLRKPFFRMLKDGAEVPFGVYARSIGEGASALDGVVNPTGIRDSLAAGATLVVQGLRLYVPSVTRFCDQVSDELGHPIHANAYLTPAHSRGAGAHYDYHSVFIRQVWGKKFWRVQAPVERLPKEPCRDGLRFDTPVVLETWLEPGDCLYLPRGYVHDGWTEKHPSLHLTCSMLDPHTWVDILVGGLRARALDQSAELRSVLPMQFADHGKELATAAAVQLRRLRTILDDLSANAIAAAAIRHYGPDAWDFRLPSGFEGILDVLGQCQKVNSLAMDHAAESGWSMLRPVLC